MSATIKKNSVYVELDTLLDTRFSLLTRLNRIIAEEQFYTGKYHNRLIDKFDSISFDTFKEHYDNRDKSLLTNALYTPIIGHLHDFTNNTLNLEIHLGEKYAPELVVNIYPYKLSDNELRVIGNYLIDRYSGLLSIEFINLSTSFLTPGYLKERFSLVYMYNVCGWLEFFSENKTFLKFSCPEVGLTGPYLIFKEPEVYNEEEINQALHYTMHLAEPFINLRFQPVKDFSLVIRPKSKA